MILKNNFVLNLFNSGFTFIISIVQISILARYLSPSEFGIVAFISLILVFPSVIAEFGLSSSIIQQKNISKLQLSTLYWINIILGLFIYTILFLISFIVDYYYKYDDIQFAITVMGISLLLNTIYAQYDALLNKYFRYLELLIINIISSIIGLVVAITLVMNDYGYMSIIYAGVVVHIIKLVFFKIYSYKNDMLPSFIFSIQVVKENLKFGLYRSLASSLRQINTRIDTIALAILFTPEIFGYYSLARKFSTESIEKIHPIFLKVSFSEMSRLQSHRRVLKKYFLTFQEISIGLVFPVVIFLVIYSAEITTLIFNKEWSLVISQMMQMLLVFAFLRFIMSLNGPLLLAVGKAKETFKFQKLLLFTSTPIILITAYIFEDIFYILISMICYSLYMIIMNFKMYIKNIINITYKEYFLNLFSQYYIIILYFILFFCIKFIDYNVYIAFFVLLMIYLFLFQKYKRFLQK